MKARHPRLEGYISDACAGLREMILKGSLSEVAVVVLGPGHEPLERVVFRIGDAEAGGAAPGADALHQAVFNSLRAVLAKISMSGALMKKAPAEGIETFELVAYTDDARVTGAVTGALAGGSRYVSADGRLDWVAEDTRLGRVELAEPQKVVSIKSVVVGTRRIDVTGEQR